MEVGIGYKLQTGSNTADVACMSCVDVSTITLSAQSPCAHATRSGNVQHHPSISHSSKWVNVLSDMHSQGSNKLGCFCHVGICQLKTDKRKVKNNILDDEGLRGKNILIF